MHQAGSFANILYDTMPSEASVRVVKLQKSETETLFGTRSAKVTDVTRSSSSIGTEENPVQPSMEAARGSPLCDNKAKAQISCIDLRVQGEPDRMMEDEAHKKSLTQSLLLKLLQSPNKDNLMA